MQQAHLIVFGNEKGGSGKSTTAMHVAIALIRLGYKVGTIDLDARQGTLTRYMRNRWQHVAATMTETPSPFHMAIDKSAAADVAAQMEEEKAFFGMALDELRPICDFIVIDTPGTDSHLSRLAHSHADTIVTPMNDSFVDLDLLADVDPQTHAINGASVYTKMVHEQMQIRRDRDGGTIRWIVMRNRLSSLNARNKQEIGDLLTAMADRFGFAVAPGFSERVIFRELFLKGLTLLDLKEDGDKSLTLSQIAARQEVRQLIRALTPEHYRGYAHPAKS